MVMTLQPDDVVFMYAAGDEQAYSDYGATVVAWGGAHTLTQVRRFAELGIHATGTMWCLTAGAENLHKSADLREATARDIEGNPIPVPWLPDHVYEGTPSWFGCTNHPSFRAHVRKEVCNAMGGGALGLHVDDHLGSAQAAASQGGCFCDYCMRAFSHWLTREASPSHLAEAGVNSFDDLDYRDLVRRFASTRRAYLVRQHEIPLHQAFVDCQLQLAAEHTRQLGELAAEVTGHAVTLSANTSLPHLEHIVVAPYLTYLVGEVAQHAARGTDDLIKAVHAYRMAEAIGKPIAATAMGWDWAYVKEHGCSGLVQIWIALAYACGQRLMAPHHMWCFTPEKGTHWYDGPTEAYAPLYRFVRRCGELFRDTVTVGPLTAPQDVPSQFRSHEQRHALQSILAQGDPRPLTAGDRLWVFPRRRADGAAIVHIVNLAYDVDQDCVATQKDIEILLPDELYQRAFSQATVYSFDADPDRTPMTCHSTDLLNGASVRLSEQRLWSVVLLE